MFIKFQPKLKVQNSILIQNSISKYSNKNRIRKFFLVFFENNF
jgi:hypothetical protein